MRRALAVLWAAVAAVVLRADEPPPLPPLDLGLGLTYVRIHQAPAELPPTESKLGSVVLDLRYARTDDAGATAVGAWIRFHASVRSPIFVLVNPRTAGPLLELLESNAPVPGLITVGSPSSRFVPDVTITVPPAEEKKAYELLDHGGAVATLLADNPDKPRHDEASIARDHAALASGELAEVEEGDDSAESTDKPKTPPPVIDVALQRAVQLHRGLVALRKI